MKNYSKNSMLTKYKATPYLNNEVGVKYFAYMKDAVTYLNKYTGMTMTDIEWKILGKIKSNKSAGLERTRMHYKRQVGYTSISICGPGISEDKEFCL
jgi:hypothetical protein|tara:strand:+ start:76 stop:366 length:291 start_codon:yes stop_codon:yes gene_type:complete